MKTIYKIFTLIGVVFLIITVGCEKETLNQDQETYYWSGGKKQFLIEVENVYVSTEDRPIVLI